MPKQKALITTSGPLFESVQQTRVFNDSKYFVDCRPKQEPEHIMQAWQHQKNNPDFSLRSFIEQYFHPPEGEQTPVELPKSSSCREHVRALWPLLFRRASQPGAAHENDSLLPLPYPYVVPGGRFREIYYWDSYFTALGLTADGYTDMLLNMTRNFAHLIETCGQVPNGNRSYYLSRSQPPFFALMAELCAQHFGPQAIHEFLPALQKEYAFWSDYEDGSQRRCINIKRAIAAGEEGKSNSRKFSVEGHMNRYWDDNPVPREESWYEDTRLAATLPEARRPQLYRNIRAACESGWDFTSRWLADGQHLLHIETTRILPVDLNALLWNLEHKLAMWLPQEQAAEKQAFAHKAKKRETLIQALCWNEQTGFFHDVRTDTLQPTQQPSLAGAFPLFLGLATEAQARRVAGVLRDEFLMEGGLVSTPIQTGQQWDAPNGWAPLQWVAYSGLKRYGFTELAAEIRRRWLRSNEIIFDRHHKMVEKYDVVNPGGHAGGGEYPLQDGFGWSNGVYAALYDDAP